MGRVMDFNRVTVGLATLCLLISGCGGGGGSTPPQSYTVGGTVSGLSGSGLVLADNGGDPLPVTSTATSFQFATHIASGQPFAVTVQTQPSSPSQTCVVAHGSGLITGNDITNVAVTCTTNSGFQISGTVSGLTGSGLVLSGAGTVTISQSGPFQFPNGLTSGDVYALSVASNPTHPLQACSISPTTGTVGGTNIVIAVTCQTPVEELIIGDNLRMNSFPIDPTSGNVGPANGSTGASQTSGGLVTDPTGKRVYIVVPNVGIEVFVTDPTTGALTAIAGSPFYAGLPINGAILEPSGHFLIAGGNASAAYSFMIDATTGAPTEVAGSPFAAIPPPAGYSPYNGGAFISATPSFVYLLQDFYGCSCGWIPGYAIDGATGALSPFAPNSTILGEFPVPVGIVDRSNGYLYFAFGGITTYAINAATGALTATSSVAAGPIGAFTLTPDGRFLYYTNGNGVWGFSTNSATGKLATIPGSPFAVNSGTGAEVQPMAISRSGAFLYVLYRTPAGGSGNLVGLSIDSATGALTPIPGSPFPVTAEPSFIVSIALN